MSRTADYSDRPLLAYIQGSDVLPGTQTGPLCITSHIGVVVEHIVNGVVIVAFVYLNSGLTKTMHNAVQ
jgi:hypothetical protein